MSTIDQLIQFDLLKTTNRFYKYSRFNYNAKFMLSVVHKFSRDKITMDGYFGYSTKKRNTAFDMNYGPHKSIWLKLKNERDG